VKLDVLEQASSTMAEARARAEAGAPDGTTVLALTQTEGVGRRGRSWFSPPGGVYLTTVLRMGGEAQATWPSLALVAGLAVRRTLAELGAQATRLKWPNDVVVGRKKIAGILLESLEECVLVGIGINRLERGALVLDESMALRYIGLFDLIETTPSVETIAKATLQAFQMDVARWRAEGFEGLAEAYAAVDALTGQMVRAEVSGRAIQGVARGVNSQGALQVETDRGVECIQTGEIEWVRPQ